MNCSLIHTNQLVRRQTFYHLYCLLMYSVFTLTCLCSIYEKNILSHLPSLLSVSRIYLLYIYGYISHLVHPWKIYHKYNLWLYSIYTQICLCSIAFWTICIVYECIYNLPPVLSMTALYLHTDRIVFSCIQSLHWFVLGFM